MFDVVKVVHQLLLGVLFVFPAKRSGTFYKLNYILDNFFIVVYNYTKDCDANHLKN